MFLKFSYPIRQSRTLHDLTGSENSKMAASKLAVSISCRVNMIGTQLQRTAILMFSGSSNMERLVGMRSDVWITVNQRGRLKTRSRFSYRISQLVYTIATKFQRLYPCFQGRSTQPDYCGYCPTCGLVVN